MTYISQFIDLIVRIIIVFGAKKSNDMYLKTEAEAASTIKYNRQKKYGKKNTCKIVPPKIDVIQDWKNIIFLRNVPRKIIVCQINVTQ